MLSVWPSPNASENMFLSTWVNNKLGTGIKEAFHVKWSVVPSGYWRPDGTLTDSASVVCSCFLPCYSVTSHNSVWNRSPPLSLMALYKWLTDKTLKNNFPEVPHSSNVLTLKGGRGFLVPDDMWLVNLIFLEYLFPVHCVFLYCVTVITFVVCYIMFLFLLLVNLVH